MHRFAATKWSLAFQILGHQGLGDLRPSQLLDAMMALLPAGEPPGIILQALFLQRLLADMRDHLVAANLESPREMAILADRMWDSRSEKTATVAAVRGVSPAEHGRDHHQRSPRHGAHTPIRMVCASSMAALAPKLTAAHPPARGRVPWQPVTAPPPAATSSSCAVQRPPHLPS